MATVGGEQTHTTSVIKKTLNPYWNEPFDLYVMDPLMLDINEEWMGVNRGNRYRRVNEDSILAIQIFDQKKFKKKDQGFLGVINVRIGDVIDLGMGGDGTFAIVGFESCPATDLLRLDRNAHSRPQEIKR